MRRGLFSRLGVSLLAHVYKRFECSGGVCADVVQPCVERAGVLALPCADILRDSECLFQRHDFDLARLSVLHALVLLLVAVLMIPAYAWADVLPDTPDETVLGTKVGRAVDPNSAVFVAVGKSIESLTSEQQAAFINATTGTEGLESYAYFRGTMYTPTSTVGPVSATYYSTLTGTEYAMACAAARSDIVNYLKGSGSGGSSGSGGTDEVVSNPTICNGYVGEYILDESWVSVSGTAKTINFTNYDTFKQWLTGQELDNVIVMVEFNNAYITQCSVVIYASKEPISITYTDGTVQNGHRKKRVTITGTDIVKNNTSYYMNIGADSFDCSVSSLSTRPNDTYTIEVHGLWSSQGGSGGGGGGSGGGDEPVTPPVEQPTNPTGLTVTGPTININTGGNNSTTTTADLTPILEMLRIINDNIGIVNGNITSFSDWFGDAWGDYVDWLQLWFERFGLSLDNIYAQQELVGNNIVDELREIEDVLWYIFYKPDPEYPTPAAYDDSAVLAKLQEIIDYLGGFETDYEPDIDDGNTASEQLAADVSSLKAKFPFCMPFELHALLALQQAPMEIPVFTVTLPMWGTLTFDMAQWSDTLAICRACSILWVIGGLFTLTSKMISYFGMPSLGGD